MNRSASIRVHAAIAACLVCLLVGLASIALMSMPQATNWELIAAQPAAAVRAPAIAAPESEAMDPPESEERMSPIAPPGETLAGVAPDEVLEPTVSAEGRLRAIALVEPNFRALRPDWQARVSARFAGAAELLRTAAGIELELGGPPRAWEPSAVWTGLDDLLHVLERDGTRALQGSNATLAVGIGAQVGSLSTGSMCGLALDLRNTCVILDLLETGEPDQLARVTIAHEIGHCLGCFHVADETSIMAPRPGAQLAAHFDAANREVLSLTKGYDVSRGEQAFPEHVLRRIADLARDHGAPAEHNPGAGAFEGRAYRALADRGDSAECARLCRIALSYDDDRPFTHYNLAVALGNLGERTEALVEIERAIRCDPSFAARQQVRRLRRALEAGRPVTASRKAQAQ